MSSDNFVNALQGTDALVGGMFGGLQSIADRNRARANDATMAAAQEQSELANWINYATDLEQRNRLLEAQLQLANRNYEALQRELQATNQNYQEYIQLLISRIRKIDDSLQRQSANAHAYEKMRDRLVEKLAQLADPATCALLTQEEHMNQLKEDWDYFMEHNDVRSEVPSMVEVIARRGPAPR